jgi:DNA protecting protein DprA
MRPRNPAIRSKPQQALDAGAAWHAALLAAAESRPDGWLALPAEVESQIADGTDVSGLLDLLRRSGELPGIGGQADKWRCRLDRLRAARPAVRVLDVTDARYPVNLRSIPDRPALLFVEGELLEADQRAVAIVGSRQASPTGLHAANEVAAGLAQLGFTIVSGLAKGIDTAAHQAALGAGGRTLAVMGTGIDRRFPSENAEIANQIPTGGALLSQFPPGHAPTKTTFPARNAVIAGLSLGSVLIEAQPWSGSRIEGDRSLEQGRPVFVWAPVMAGRPWVHQFASTPGVHVVESVEQITTILASQQRA